MGQKLNLQTPSAYDLSHWIVPGSRKKPKTLVQRQQQVTKTYFT